MAISNRSVAVTAALGVSIFALSAPAVAQSADSGLDYIVVTAQKREQNLQDVPIAVSAIGAARLQQLQISDARDLSGLAPNLVLTPPTVNFSAAVISIRGIPSGAQETFGLDMANAVYVDGIYIARSSAAGMGVLDLERVEILRGPQGTLFGRNTTGGAISFISRKPSDEFRLAVEGGYGNLNAWNAKAVVDTGALLGPLKTTFAYSHSQRQGTVDNILQPDRSKDPGARRSDAIRVAARADLGDTGSIQYIFDWARVRGSTTAFQLTNVASGKANPPQIVDGQPVVVTQQAPVGPYLASVQFMEPGCKELSAPTRVFRDKICLNSQGIATDKNWGHNLQVQNDFDIFRVKATVGYRNYDSNSDGSDLDGLGTIKGYAFSNATLFNGMPESLLQYVPSIPAAARPIIAASPVPTTTQDLFKTSGHRQQKQLSGELEFSGDNNLLDWVVGGFYFWEHGKEYNPQASAFILDTNTIFIGNFGPLGPAFAAANPARYRAVVTPAVLDYNATNESKAIYGQTTIYPSGRDAALSLTVGARYTWDNKKMMRMQNGTAPLAKVESGQDSFSKFTWNLMARYAFTPDISVYGRAATGYRSGGFNAQDPTISGTTTIPNFKPESVISYEAGVKSELFEHRLRLNVAVYHNIYSDLAVIVPVTDAPPGTFASRIGNAGKVKYSGVEADFQAAFTENFSIDGAIGYVDIKTKTFMAGQSTTPGAPPVNIASVVRATYTAPFTANVGVNARFPLGNGGSMVVGRVGFTHQGGIYSFSNALSSPFNDALKSDNQNLVDAQLSFENLPFAGGNGRVMLWVKNLTNQHNLVRAIDFGPLGFGGGYFGDPRTYGATLGMKF